MSILNALLIFCAYLINAPAFALFNMSCIPFQKLHKGSHSTTWKSTLTSDLKRDEGTRYEIYLDSKKKPTFGIGHLIKESDPEYNKPINTSVPKSRVEAVFESDLNTHIDECHRLINNFDLLPDEAKVVIGNMEFNLGRSRLSKFTKFIKAVKTADWDTAAAEMENSNWYHQVGDRSKRLKNRIQKLSR